MMVVQRQQNPDVNSYSPGTGPAESPGDRQDPNNGVGDTENNKGTDVIPLPPDSKPVAPIEEPPESDGVPVGDVDDSPKRIV